MIPSLYELKNSLIEEDENGLFWVVRNEETQEEFDNKIICQAFVRSEDESHEQMLDQGYIYYGKHDGVEFFIQENLPKSA